jgi:hypothetical protein
VNANRTSLAFIWLSVPYIRYQTAFFVFLCFMIVATLLTSVGPVAGWLADYRAREMLLGRGLGVLGIWALLNLIGSGYLLPRTDRRSMPHHFHFMNCCWGFINAVLAAVGILRTYPGAPPAGFDATAAAHDIQQTVFIFLVNAGLDIGYLVVGMWLITRAARPQATMPQRLLGYGRSILLQGGFLLVFDAAMGWLLQR